MTDRGKAAQSGARIAMLTFLAMLAFAGNSLINRAALAGGAIDWASFASLRLISGALTLVLIFKFTYRRRLLSTEFNPSAILALTGYAALFSFAYLKLTAATGALILFACVQITMQGAGLFTGHRMAALQWSGLTMAIAGLVWLLLPGLAAPSFWASAAMAAAGFAWGIYSWIGRNTNEPASATASNFIGAVPLAMLLFWITPHNFGLFGILLAIISGALTSALGYVIWYAVLPRLNFVTAGVVQLSVPAVAAMGGAVLLSETITTRLLLATAVIFAGIGLTLKARI